MTGSPHSAAPAPDVRRLRIQLATLLAGIEDLRQEWQATVELALHLRAQRQQRHQPADTATVIADLEAIMRASAAFPTGTCQPTTMDDLLPAIENAQKTYDDLLARHLAYAADHLDRSCHRPLPTASDARSPDAINRDNHLPAHQGAQPGPRSPNLARRGSLC